MQEFKSDISSSPIDLQISEAKGKEVDGQHVLAKVSGNFFVPEGVSRNNRFYPKSLWEKVTKDKDIKKRLLERRMFGTISHEQPLNDAALLEGKLSHIVTNLEVRGDQGFGEALILDTPAGRALNTVIRAGSKLFVSSRANGTFKGEKNGVPVVDPDSYQLETFDFVMDPGFLQANPSLVESLKKSFDLLLEQGSQEHNIADKPATNLNKPKENNMSVELKELLESANKQNNSLRSDLDKAVSEVEKYKNENITLTDENNHIKDELDKLKEQVKLVKKYEDIGSVEEINQAFQVANEQLDAYGELGKPEEVKEKLEKYSSLTESLDKIADSPEQIEEALDTATSVVEKYLEFGTPAEIGEAFDKIDAYQNSVEESLKNKSISALAKELNVSEEKIEGFWTKMSEKGMEGKEIEASIKDLLSDVKTEESISTKKSKGSKLSENFKKKNETTPTEETDKKANLRARLFEGTTGSRLTQHFSK